jgi:toxin ParE1/3/4
MRHLKVTYRPEAIADLQFIFSAVLDMSRNPETARGFVGRIRARCAKIGFAPHGGRPRDDLEPGLRIVPFERTAVIAYRVLSDAVDITNIFFGGRDYEALYHGIPVQEDDEDGVEVT